MNFTLLTQKYKWIGLILGFFLNPIFLIIRIISKTKSAKRENIVVVAILRLGDTVFTIPAVKNILEKETDTIIIMCLKDSELIYSEAFSDLKFSTIRFNDFSFGKRYASSKARKMLSDLNPKTIYDLTCAISSASLVFNSRANKIIGSNKVYFKGIYDRFTSLRKTPNLVDMYKDATGIKTKQDEDRLKIKSQYNINSDAIILIHPLAGWKAKEWNLSKFIELSSRLSVNYKVRIVVPPNSFSLDFINEFDKRKIEYVFSKSISELIEEIKKCSVFIGCDSGPLYIADLLGKPTFTIYGPTNPDYSKPTGEIHEEINLNISCTPQNNEQYCFTYAGVLGCPAFQCMNLLQVEEVYRKLNSFINRLQANA